MNENWERQALQDLLTVSVKEQKLARRWGIFFKLLTFGYLAVFLLTVIGLAASGDSERTPAGPHTAVVSMQGVIAAGGEVNADKVVEGLREAFKDKNTRGVILRANSPGGSPVQSGLINDEIRRLRKLYPKTALYVVMEDVCASGCYYVAAAADAIYADKASLVGSIGVLMNGFGFTGAMDKLGVERRLLTAGANKGFLDPFSPMNAEQKEKAQVMLNEIHQQFIAVVKAGRGKKLAVDNPDLFSGMVWSGETAQKLGLVDGLSSVDAVARDVIKAPNLVDFTPKSGWADRFAKQIGASMGAKLGTSFDLQLR
jgi:protease-4